MTLTEEIFATLCDGNDSAAIGQFMSLLSRVPGLRQWIRTVTLDTMSRQKLDAYLDGRMTPPPNLTIGRRLLGWLAGTSGHAQADIETLKLYKIVPASFGGLSRVQIMTLIRRYQAGRIDCASFLIAHAWRSELAGNQNITSATAVATMQFLHAAIAENKPQLLRHLAHAAEFFDGQAIGTIKGPQFGHSAWWKLNLLGYMLAHPKPAYRTGEFEKHLASLKLAVDPSDIRRFCRQHEIARDTRHGRPKKAAPHFSNSLRKSV